MIEFNSKNSRYYNFVLKFRSLTNTSNVYIAKTSRINMNTRIGGGTRINGKIIIKGQGNCEIKKYCAIGEDVRIITSNHRANVMNLQYALQQKLGIKAPVDDKKDVTVGNNVWIGDNVIILPGVEIGNGAILGAGAVITKNIPAYAVVAGSPAKVIKYRFSEDKIKEIEDLQWWNWSISEMKKNITYFNSIL